MQHDHVMKKLNFDLTTRMGGGGGYVGKIFATMLLHSCPCENDFDPTPRGVESELQSIC